MANIKKIKLSNGSVYSIFDEGALRLNKGPDGTKKYPDEPDDLIITGNGVVDELILKGHIYVTAIDDVPVSTAITNVLVQDTSNGEIKKRSTDKLLEDIGGISYSMDEGSGTLSFKIGKQ